MEPASDTFAEQQNFIGSTYKPITHNHEIYNPVRFYAFILPVSPLKFAIP